MASSSLSLLLALALVLLISAASASVVEVADEDAIFWYFSTHGRVQRNR